MDEFKLKPDSAVIREDTLTGKRAVFIWHSHFNMISAFQKFVLLSISSTCIFWFIALSLGFITKSQNGLETNQKPTLLW